MNPYWMVDVKKPWKSSVGKSSKVLKSAMCAETFSIDVIRPKLHIIWRMQFPCTLEPLSHLMLLWLWIKLWIHTLWIVTFIIFRGPSHPTHFIQLTVLVLRESECASLSPLAFSAKRKRLSRTRAHGVSHNLLLSTLTP